MWDFKKHLTFIIFISLFLYSINGYSQENIGDFKNSYQYQYINNEIKKTENTTLSQLQNLLTSTDITKKQQYFIHHNLAYLHFKLHNKNKTLSQLNTAINLIKSTDLDTYHLAKSLLLRGKTYGIMFRDIKTAITDLKEAIQASHLSTHAKITNLRFDLQTAMAQAYNQLGQLDKAQEYSEQSLQTATLLNDKNETIYALIIAGRIAFQQNNFDLAYQNYLNALKLSDSSTPKNQIASIELRLAIAYESQSNFEQALIHAQKAATLYSQLSSERLQIKSLRVLGNIYLSLGQDIDTALVHFINGLSIAKSINSVNSIGQMQHLIGRAYLLENNINKAKKYLNSAQSVLKKSKSWFYLGLNTIELAVKVFCSYCAV
jgi:tetratricopeptide (TPR) repeat protein